MDIGQWIVIGLSVLMGVWFGAGSFYNRKRGIATYRWLQKGLQSLGKISEASWIGSSGTGARLVVSSAESPFRRIEVIFLLESREILPLWVFNRIRSKRDEMILKAGLRSTPVQEVELFRRGDRQAQSFLAQSGTRSYQEISNQNGLRLAYRGPLDSDLIGRLSGFSKKYPDAIRRISVQRKNPHLMVRVDLPPLRESSPEEFFQSMREMLKSVDGG